MKYFNALRVLIAVIIIAVRYGLKAGPYSKTTTSLTVDNYNEKSRIIEICELKRLMAAIDMYVDEQGILSIEISGCPGLAAPALLFLLKRRGFSRCKAWVEPTGLALSALR